jgi:hypothetical protein
MLIVRLMKRLNATEASHRFSCGRAAANTDPATGGIGNVLKEVLRTNRPDEAWSDELRELREGIEPVTDPWRD